MTTARLKEARDVRISPPLKYALDSLKIEHNIDPTAEEIWEKMFEWKFIMNKMEPLLPEQVKPWMIRRWKKQFDRMMNS